MFKFTKPFTAIIQMKFMVIQETEDEYDYEEEDEETDEEEDDEGLITSFLN